MKNSETVRVAAYLNDKFVFYANNKINRKVAEGLIAQFPFITKNGVVYTLYIEG